MASDPAVRFREAQRFPAPVFLLPAGLLVALAGVSAAYTGALWPVFLVIAGLFVGLWLLFRVDTEVSQSGVLRVRLFPFPWRVIRPLEVVSAEVRTYRPLIEYGGWGLRYGWGRGWAYNARGNRGVQLELTGGRRVLVGSQRAEELLAALPPVAPPAAPP